MYPRLLDFTPVVMTSLSLSMARSALCPMVVARGNDQVRGFIFVERHKLTMPKILK